MEFDRRSSVDSKVGCGVATYVVVHVHAPVRQMHLPAGLWDNLYKGGILVSVDGKQSVRVAKEDGEGREEGERGRSRPQRAPVDVADGKGIAVAGACAGVHVRYVKVEGRLQVPQQTRSAADSAGPRARNPDCLVHTLLVCGVTVVAVGGHCDKTSDPQTRWLLRATNPHCRGQGRQCPRCPIQHVEADPPRTGWMLQGLSVVSGVVSVSAVVDAGEAIGLGSVRAYHEVCG